MRTAAPAVTILAAMLAVFSSLPGCTGNMHGSGAPPADASAYRDAHPADASSGIDTSAATDTSSAPDASATGDTTSAADADRPDGPDADAPADVVAPPDADSGPGPAQPDATSDVADAAAAPDTSPGPQPLEDPTRSSQINMADPDTVQTRDGQYITYGTTIGAGTGPRCNAQGRLFVPYLLHGRGNSVGISDCAAGDAMPAGPGAWAQPDSAVWAPGVAFHKDQYIMFYTATKRGTGQKCIGRATSARARGPFVTRSEWACPPQGRWAIDANPFVAGGKLYVAYRDDYITTYPETGLSVVRTDDQGQALWDTRRDLLKSTDISWDTTRISGETRVVENPSMFRHDGVWYVAYSGNNWDSARYATGIARCGTNPLPAQRCTPLQDGVRRPYFGFTGSAGLDPYRGLPGNHEGPGGMDVFEAADGSLRVAWHWWNAAKRTRHVAVGRLLKDAGGFYVGE